MPKFRKKPVVIEAVQYTKGVEDCWLVLTTGNDVQRVFDKEEQAWDWLHENSHMADSVAPGIRTLEGALRIDPEDWIITGIKGERYPCKPDIFAATYEPAD